MASVPGHIVRASDVAVQACRVTRNATQSVSTSGFTTIAFNDEVFDTDNMHSTVTDNSRITINTAGIYIVGFHGSMESGSDYTRVLVLLMANGVSIARSQATGTTTNVSQVMDVNTVQQFDVGDYVEVQISQSSGGTKSLTAVAEYTPIFYAARIGS